MTSAVSFMTFTLTFAGVVQTHMQRVVGGYSYMEVQDQLGLFYWLRLGAGVVTAIGAAVFVYAVLGPVREQLTTARAPNACAGRVRARNGRHDGPPARGRRPEGAVLPAAGHGAGAVRARLAQPPAPAAEGTDGLRQDPVRRAHGAPAGPAAARSPATTT